MCYKNSLTIETLTFMPCFPQIGLLQNYADSVEDNINALFKMALERVAFLPFGFLIDMYRWDLFSGKTPQEEWNSHWESLRYIEKFIV